MATGILAEAATSESLEAAHRQVLADPSLQFRFVPPPSQPETPEWLNWLAETLQALAPALNVIFWGGVILIAALILYAIAREILRRLPGTAAAIASEAPAAKPQFHPTRARAQALLEEADRLAREGRFNEAVRVLLHRSINDIEETFPNVILPSLTAREIGRIEELSARGRDVFVLIARAVERSLFGGRALGASDFAACRGAYADFVFGPAPP
jgi:hypothetical protein